MAAKTTVTVSVKNLPANLNVALRTGGYTKRKVTLCILSEELYPLEAHNTQWDGGTRNYYWGFDFGGSKLNSADYLGEGAVFHVLPKSAWVVSHYFQGQECTATVYVNNVDLFAFYGIEVPAGLAAEVACDWVDEYADEIGGRVGQNMKATAAFVRELVGLVTQ